MDIETGFASYETKKPQQRNGIRFTSLALRRGGVRTMEALCELYFHDRRQLEKIRDIGPKRIELIGDILKLTGFI